MQLPCALFYKLFGSFSWHRPPWLKQMPRSRKIWIAAIIALLIVLGIGYDYYQHLPKPPLVTARITAPSTTPHYCSLLTPTPITIDFGIETVDSFTKVSAAPLTLIGKEIHSGIKISPEIDGKWQWQGDNELTFTPKENWPAEQTYLIRFQRDLFASQIKMAKYHYTFSTPPLKIDEIQSKFYHDPRDSFTKMIVATVKFNFPVDSHSLTRNTRLVMQTIKNGTAPHIPLTISYDQHQRIAYIRSDVLTLSDEPLFVNLIIDKGVHAMHGPSQTKDMITRKILIPDSKNFFQITHVSADIARNKNDHPEQLLSIYTSVGIRSRDLAEFLNVYILPADCPASDLQPEQKDYQWSKPGEVTSGVLELASSLEIQPLPDEHPYPTCHRFRFNAPLPSYLYIRISKGATCLGDFTLSQDYATVIPTPQYPQHISFIHHGSVMALSSAKKLTVAVRSVPEMKFSISQILPHNVNHLVTQTYGNFQNPKFLHPSFNSDAISQVFSEFRQFDSSHHDLQYTALDLEHYLADSKSSLGLFLLKAEAWDSKRNAPTGLAKERLILITDMDLIVKDNADDTHDLFVHSITLGTPVENGQVALLGKNGLPILKATTNAEGHVHFPSVKSFNQEKEPVAYLVRNGEDISFIPYQRNDRMLNYSRFNVGGISSDPEKNLSAYLFSDRDIYRPGDEVQIGAIVKNRFASDPAPGLPLEAVLTDLRGAIVLDQKMSLPASHFFSLSYLLPQTSPTGQYHLNLYIVKDNKQEQLLGFKTLRIEEFLPDRLKMEAQFVENSSPLGWLSPDNLKSKISLWNLFGTPAANHRITAKLILSPGSLYFPKFADYRFDDPLLDQKRYPNSFTENLTERLSDVNGEAEFNLNLERFEHATYQLIFFAEGFEAEGGRAVSAEISALVTPLEYLVGYQSKSDRHYLKLHSRENVRFIAINSRLEQIEADDLYAQQLAVESVSTLVRKADGTYQYQSVSQEIPIGTQPFKISSEGSEFYLPTDVIGDFVLLLKNRRGDLLSKLYYSVVGESRNSLPKNAELAVKLKKSEFQPGETIEMQITAPYIGVGLISIERDKVHAFKWFQTDSNSSVQTIELPPDFQGNGYINVAFVRSWDSEEIYINPLSCAVMPFNISSKQQTLPIRLNVPACVRPGDCLPIEFSSDKPAHIVLFAVDEGILQVSNYQTPDPLAHFFRKQALRVNTSQIADLILPKYTSNESSSVGGDNRAKVLSMSLNPFKRKVEKAVAFWSGIVESDEIPKIVNYQVPDYFNGRLRVMAVAAGPKSVGSAVAHTEVQAHFVIQPTVPAFISPGDTFTVTAAIANTSKDFDNDTPVIVRLMTSPCMDNVGPMELSLLIPPGKERTAAFQIKAGEALGEAHLTFAAEQNDRFSQIHTTLSIRPAIAYCSTLISGFDDAQHKTVNYTQSLYPEYRQLQATASTNPLILAHGLQDYLASVPHDSTEQLISKAFVQLAMAKQPFFQVCPNKAHEEFRQTLQMLRQRQTHNGGFCYWPSQQDNSSDAMVTIYAMDYLTEAKQQGYQVPANLFNPVKIYLENFAKNDATTLPKARLQAYAIYLLTRNGMVTTNYLTNLHLGLNEKQAGRWRKDLVGVYMAATYKLLQSIPEANDLIGSYALQGSQIQPISDFYNNLVCDAQYFTLLARHFPERLRKMHGMEISALAQGLAGDQLNSLSAAYCVQTLCAYAQIQGVKADHSLRICEILADETENQLISTTPLHQKVNFSAEAKALRFDNPEKLPYFYQMTQAGFPKIAPEQPVKNGLEIYREYQDDNGHLISTIEQGKKVNVKIIVRSLNLETAIGLSQQNHRVAIIDLLPGGFELVPHSVTGCDGFYADVRADRVIFYCSVGPSAEEFRYSLRAVNRGSYAVPPIFAQVLYQPTLQAQGASGRIEICK
ncbi:MAG: alpha-2-macroglobulin [Chlamydiales bacterium]